MKPKLSLKERIAAVRAFESGAHVSQITSKYKISKALLYRLKNRFKKAKGSPAALVPKIRKLTQHPKLTPEQRLEMIKKVEAEERVASVCRQYGVSRTIFYRLLKRYKEAEVAKVAPLEVLENEPPTPKHFWHLTPSDIEKKVLDIVAQFPELSAHKIVQVLPQVAGHPILSNKGVQNVLRRHNLGTFEQRLAFSAAQERLVVPRISLAEIPYIPLKLWRLLYAPFATIPKLVWLATRSFGTFLALGVIVLVFFFWIKFILLVPGISKIGTIFATTSLTFGFLFFLYSLKYYLSAILVLTVPSSSAKATENKQEESNGKEGLPREARRAEWGFWSLSKILKIPTIPFEKFLAAITPKTSPPGLIADVSEVKLEKYPFVSIHIPLYNEKKVAERILKATLAQDYPKDKYEVIVADDSTDETTEIVKKFETDRILESSRTGLEHPRVRVIHRDNREGFKGGALEEARKITDSRAEYIIIFDADFIPFPDTVQQFLKYFQLANSSEFIVHGKETTTNNEPRTTNYGSIAAVQGYQPHSTEASRGEVAPAESKIAAIQGYQWHVLNKSENWITRGVRCEYAGSYVVERSATEIYSGLKMIAGSVYCIRRDILDKFGWGTSITEDFQLTLRLYAAGYKVIYTPYIQAPSECVSTIRRLVRQRMRWAEGHTFNVKKYLLPLLLGRTNPQLAQLDQQKVDDGRLKIENSGLTFKEKLEFVYLAPYYLQAAFFMIGTLSWFASETIFATRLPFWTATFGWSLVFTNFLALPLINTLGLFLEESEKKDYLGILSFVALAYIVTPFQAYAAVKGLIEKQEGPWFRTPKTGIITDVIGKVRLGFWWRRIWPFGQPAQIPAEARSTNYELRSKKVFHNSYFKIHPSNFRWIGNGVLIVFLITTLLLSTLASFIPQFLQVAASERSFKSLASANLQETPTPTQNDNGEILGPIVVRYPVDQNQALEYVFHPEPRVRTKYDGKEIELNVVSADGLGHANPTKALTENGSYYYQNVFDSVDLRYTPNESSLTEEVILKEYKEIGAINYELKTIGLTIAKRDNQIFAAPEEGGEWLFAFNAPFMFEKANLNNKSYGIEYHLEKDTFGWKLKKVLTEEGRKWLSDPKRKFPVIIDPTSVTSIIQAINYSPGGGPRRLVYSTDSSAWYAVYEQSDVWFEKCTLASACDQDADWINRTDLDTGDTDNFSIAAFYKSPNIWVAWIDNSADDVQFRPINTSSADALGNMCDTADQGTIDGTNTVSSILQTADGDVYVAYFDTSTDAEFKIFRIASANLGNCAGGTNWTDITTGSGFTQNDYAKLVDIGNNVHAIFQDGNLSHSVYVDDATPGWDTSNVTIAANATTEWAVASDGTDIWVIALQGSTGADLWTCDNCPTTSPTWTDSNDPFSGLSNVTEVSSTILTTDNKLIAYIMQGTGTGEKVTFKSTTALGGANPTWELTSYDMGFAAPGSSGFSSLSAVQSTTVDTQAAAVVNDPTTGQIAYEFATLPENLFILLFLAPFLPGVAKKLKRK